MKNGHTLTNSEKLVIYFNLKFVQTFVVTNNNLNKGETNMDGIDETLYELLVWDELETDIGSLEEFCQEFSEKPEEFSQEF